MQQPYKHLLDKVNTLIDKDYVIFTAIENDPAYDNCILKYDVARGMNHNNDGVHAFVPDTIGNAYCESVIKTFEDLCEIIIAVKSIYNAQLYTDPDYFELIEKIHKHHKDTVKAARRAFTFYHWGQHFKSEYTRKYMTCKKMCDELLGVTDNQCVLNTISIHDIKYCPSNSRRHRRQPQPQLGDDVPVRTPLSS